jgi:hypothetical protein
MTRIQLNYIEIVFVITYKIRLVAKPDGFFYAFFGAETIGFFVVIVLLSALSLLFNPKSKGCRCVQG